jgi:peptidoglycan/LPS O-acetylase OafA/YrhL
VAAAAQLTGSRPADAARLDAFGGLRASAALSVVAYHVGKATGAGLTGPFAPIVSELKAGDDFLRRVRLSALPSVRPRDPAR